MDSGINMLHATNMYSVHYFSSSIRNCWILTFCLASEFFSTGLDSTCIGALVSSVGRSVSVITDTVLMRWLLGLGEWRTLSCSKPVRG